MHVGPWACAQYPLVSAALTATCEVFITICILVHGDRPVDTGGGEMPPNNLPNLFLKML